MSALFAGNWKEAILYLQNTYPGDVKDPAALNALIIYIWRKRHYITCTAPQKGMDSANQLEVDSAYSFRFEGLTTPNQPANMQEKEYYKSVIQADVINNWFR